MTKAAINYGALVTISDLTGLINYNMTKKFIFYRKKRTLKLAKTKKFDSLHSFYIRNSYIPHMQVVYRAVAKPLRETGFVVCLLHTAKCHKYMVNPNTRQMAHGV